MSGRWVSGLLDHIGRLALVLSFFGVATYLSITVTPTIIGAAMTLAILVSLGEGAYKAWAERAQEASAHREERKPGHVFAKKGRLPLSAPLDYQLDAIRQVLPYFGDKPVGLWELEQAMLTVPRHRTEEVYEPLYLDKEAIDALVATGELHSGEGGVFEISRNPDH